MNVVYLAGPYRAPTIRGVVQNIRAAEAVALQLWQAGFAVICPHMNTALLDGAITDEVVMAGDLELLARCDAIVMLRDWQSSKGAKAERLFAREHGIPVIHWHNPSALADLATVLLADSPVVEIVVPTLTTPNAATEEG